MVKATINDLILEQWFRKRNSGELKWVAKDGKEIPVKDMTDSHLKNAISRISSIEEINEIVSENSANVF